MLRTATTTRRGFGGLGDPRRFFHHNTVVEPPEWTTPKGTSSGTMICICMAANYLAAYYLSGSHTNEHTRIDTRLHTFIPHLHSMLHLPKAGEKLLLIDQPLGVAQGSTSADMKPMVKPYVQGLGGVAWHWHRLGIGIGLCIGHGPWHPPLFHHNTHTAYKLFLQYSDRISFIL